jgi:carboxyl-terminal processing protease
MRMNRRQKRFRTILLLGTAFLTGAAIGPASDLIASRFARGLGINDAFARETERANTSPLLALVRVVFERIRSDYVDPVSGKQLIENAINGMLTGLDPHSNYMNADKLREMQVVDKGEFGGIGIEIALDNGFLKVSSVMDDTPAFKASIKAGDIIAKLNSTPAEGLSLQNLTDQIRGPPNTTVTLTIERKGVDRPLEISVQREVIRIQVVTRRMEPGHIGYLRLTKFTEQAEGSLKQGVQSLRQQAGGKLRAFVLDLRDNSGGLFDQAVAVSGDFVERGEIVSTRGRHPEETERFGTKGMDIIGGAPMVVLINGGSSSASEIVAGALQDHHRAVLVGTRSFGKGSVQTVIPLPDNAAMLLTTARYYTPSGRSIQGLGIVPDVQVAATHEEVPHADAKREAELNHALKSGVGASGKGQVLRTGLPPIAKTIPGKPPNDFPAFDTNRPDETDFQLQQALLLANAMASGRHTGD